MSLSASQGSVIHIRHSCGVSLEATFFKLDYDIMYVVSENACMHAAKDSFFWS